MQMKEIVLKFNTALYPKEAIIKCAYHFLDKCYILLDIDGNNYVVKITEKRTNQLDQINLEFENELLAQTVRYQVYQQTHTIREILLARAMSSTIIGATPDVEEDQLPDNVDSLDNILADWFERNEK